MKARIQPKKPLPAKKRGCLRRLFSAGFILLVLLYGFWLCSLAMLRFVDPITSGVQIQRRIEAALHHTRYQKKYQFVPLRQISPDLQHASIAAEDARFYQHHGIDWKQVDKVAERSRETGEIARGASTMTQQLVKNLYFTTHRNPLRKVFEYTLAPLAELILGKQRILELYLNVVEWGPGVFGAEAAARYHYGIPASQLGREQSARLAACLPSPLHRRPARMSQSAAAILQRMRQMRW